MAGKADSSIEILDQSRISGSGPISGAIIPLSFFDIKWLLCPSPMQRIIFYDLPQYSVSQFTEHALPSLKRSLSVALEVFSPLAGSLTFPPPPAKPFFCCDGHGVPFTAAVSDADFVELTSNHPQAASLLRPLLQPLPTPHVKDDGTRVAPVLAVRVTLFPNSGICIALQCEHVAADGPGFGHFMKTWASICRAEVQGDTSCIDRSLPVFDRTVIKDPTGLEPILLKQWLEKVSPWEENSPSLNPSPSHLYEEKLRASFTVTKAQIDRLKSWISGQIQDQPLLRISTFVAICAYVWVCFIKSKEIGETHIVKPDMYHFRIMVDCRARLGYPIPKTYIGNCLESCFASVKREDLVGQHGIASAARAIGAKVKELEAEGVLLRRAEHWLSDTKKFSEMGCLVTAAGSPRSRVYDVDFGWGRPRTSQVGHIDKTNAISFATSRDEEGGVEVGLALGKVSMDAFCVMFEQGLSS